MTVAGPPGGLGETWRAVDEPEGVLVGEVGRGEDCCDKVSRHDLGTVVCRIGSFGNGQRGCVQCDCGCGEPLDRSDDAT